MRALKLPMDIKKKIKRKSILYGLTDKNKKDKKKKKQKRTYIQIGNGNGLVTKEKKER
jgi:hypothetical protein